MLEEKMRRGEREGSAGGTRSEVACRMCRHAPTRRTGTVDGYAFTACPACAFVFAPALTQDELDRLYESGYHGVDEGAPASGWAEDTAEFLEPALARLPDEPLRILDFGTGQSRTPEILRERGHRVIAADVAPPIPEREHPDRLTGDVRALDLPLESFDLVYAYQVFEHLPEPRPVLDRLLALTRSGGLVLVHTDMEMPERFENGFEGWWYVLPPDHCAFYRHRTFDAYCEDTPHEVTWRDEKRVLIERG